MIRRFIRNNDPHLFGMIINILILSLNAIVIGATGPLMILSMLINLVMTLFHFGSYNPYNYLYNKEFVREEYHQLFRLVHKRNPTYEELYP